MADDPRLEVMTARIRLALIASGAGRAAADAAGFAPGALAAVDTADRLRALLASEGRATQLIDQALRSRGEVVEYEAVAAVLAALREVAGNG